MPPKPASVMDRDREWAALSRLWNNSSPQLVFVLGRRRVGKSFVLAPFARAVGGLYYQATRRTEAEQLDALTRLLGQHFDDPALQHAAAFDSWERLLAYLLHKLDGAPLMLVLDEFPYLVEATPALPSVLQRLVDHDLPGSRLELVLSGSHITAMRRLEAVDQPLYARRTARITFQPFHYADAARFFPGYDALERLRTYGVFGGVPGHLALLDPREDLLANVAHLLLDPSSRLFDEAQHMLDAFLGDAQVHYSILAAIGAGQRTWSGITNRVGRSSGSVSRPMSWLMEMGIVERVVPVTEARPARSKRAVYRISDPYLRTWHRFVAPLIQGGSVWHAAPRELAQATILPHLDDHMGEVFEEICRDFVRHAGRLSFMPLRVGGWWTRDEEIDVVALGAAGELLVGECKWGTIDSRDLDRLRVRARLLAAELGTTTEPQLALFSGRGPADDALRAQIRSGAVLHYSADDLFAWGG